MFMNIDALRGGVAPRPRASERTVCFILEAPCLGTQYRAWLLYLPMTQRGIVLCLAKTKGCMTWLPVNDARRKLFFCLGMTSIPAGSLEGLASLEHPEGRTLATVGEHSCKNGYRTQTELNFSGLRSEICTVIRYDQRST